MMNKEKISIESIRSSLLEENFNPSLASLMEFILELLNGVDNYEYYSDNLVSNELIDVYSKRLINLSAQGVRCGGFSETIMSLNEESSVSSMVTTDTEKYHVSILLGDGVRVIGAIFVEH